MKGSVLGQFLFVDVLLEAAKKLKASGYEITIFSPIPLGHEIEHTIGGRKNHIRFFTFFGAIMGCCLGALLALGTAALYVLPRGGRSIFPVTPTVILSYEMTILCGVLMTFIGFLLFVKLPYFGNKRIYNTNMSVDSFGLLVETNQDAKLNEIEKILKDSGATEVKRVDNN